MSIDPAIAVHICRDSLILALQQFFLQYVTLDIDQVMRRHTIRKTGILAGYQTHIRSILDGEVVSSVTTRHHRHRTTATQYCFHLNISRSEERRVGKEVKSLSDSTTQRQ